MPKLPKHKQLFIIPVIFFGFIIITYTWSLSLSNFQCVSIDRPLIHLFNANEQIVGCQSFYDLNYQQVSVTKKQADKIIAERSYYGEKIDQKEAIKYALGRAKVQAYANLKGISVSDSELSAALEEVYKNYGGKEKYLTAVASKTYTPEDRKEYIKGSLLQKKVENILVSYRITDYFQIRWDYVKTNTDTPEHLQVAKNKAMSTLNQVKDLLSKGEKMGDIKNKVVVDTNFSYPDVQINRRLDYTKNTSDPFKGVIKTGFNQVSELFCDNRSCVVAMVYTGNTSSYSSIEDFFGDLKAW